jgi:hypothetical protein
MAVRIKYQVQELERRNIQGKRYCSNAGKRRIDRVRCTLENEAEPSAGRRGLAIAG